MRPVRRDELMDYQSWEDVRAARRPSILDAKAARRVLLGEHLVFLFENRTTVWYQIQEMLRVEHIVREKDILHELHTYNELLGGPGELGVTLLIGVVEPELRAAKLSAWLDLVPTLYLELSDGTRVAPTWDERQVGEDRLSAVQYLKFDVRGEMPVAVGCDHADPALYGRVALDEEARTALAMDLDDERSAPARI